MHYNINIEESILNKKDCFYIEHFAVSSTCIPQAIPNMLLIYAAHGKGFHYIDKINYDVREGDVFIIKPNVETDFFASDSVSLSIYCCVFSPDILPFKFKEIEKCFPNLSDFLNGSRKYIRIRDTENKNIRNLMVNMIDDFTYQYSLAKYSLPLLLELTLLRIFKIYSVEQIPEIMLNSNTIVNMMMSYAVRNLHSKITLAKMSEQFHVTPQHLCRVFKKETGGTFTDFVNHMRVKAIKDELEHTDRPIYLIYNDFDFTPKYLNKLFQDETGLKLIEYKNKYNYKINNPLYKTE